MADKGVSNNRKGDGKGVNKSKPSKENNEIHMRVKQASKSKVHNEKNTNANDSEEAVSAISTCSVETPSCSCCSCDSPSTRSGEWAPPNNEVGENKVPISPDKVRLFLRKLPIANWVPKPYPKEMMRTFRGNLAYYPAYDPGYDYDLGDPACYPALDKPGGQAPRRKPSFNIEKAYDYYNPGGDPYRYPDYDLGFEPDYASLPARSSTCSCEYQSEKLDRDLGASYFPDQPPILSLARARAYAEIIVNHTTRKARKRLLMELGIWDEDELKPKMPKKAPNYLADHKYMEPVPDPYSKAIKYLEKHCILQLFQKLTSDIVYERPKNPVDFIINEIEEMKKARSNPPKTASDGAATGSGDK